MLSIVIASLLSTGLLNASSWQMRRGESLHYKIAFSSTLTGSIKGGEATLSVNPTTVKVGKNNAYYTKLSVGTSGIIERVYRAENLYESYINTSNKAPLIYRQTVRENKHERADTVVFNQQTNSATYRGKQMRTPQNTQDFVSIIYYLRSVNTNNLKKGDFFNVPFFTSKQVVNAKVIYGGIEQVRVNGKMVECHTFRPQMDKGKVFNSDYPGTVWISTDSKRLPMLIDAKLAVGRMKMELLSSN